MTTRPLRTPEWQLRLHGTEAELRVTGDWIGRETGIRDDPTIRRILAEAGGAKCLRIDASSIGSWDSALVVFVLALRQAATCDTGTGLPIELDEAGLPEAARRLLALAAEGESGPPPAVVQPAASLVVRLGQSVIGNWLQAIAVFALVGQTVLRAGAALAGRLRSRGGDVLQLMREAGAGALGIVAIVNGLVGGILAFVGAVQLRRFGAEIYVADLVGVAMVREMAAVMTAIVMAGRTGGAYAAEIATMQGNEEIDALTALGIPVHDYLVMPRIAALVAMMPVLYIYACALGLIGGFAVAWAILDVTPAAYLEETRQAIVGTQFAIGSTKSVVFGAMVALTGCHIGLQAGRSAADVGQAATSAVVAGIIGVIALDAVFAVCTNALGV